MFGSIAKMFTGSKDTYLRVNNQTSQDILVDVPSVDPFDWQSDSNRPDQNFSMVKVYAGDCTPSRKETINTAANGNMVKMYLNIGNI